MKYFEATPNPRLRDYVKCFWFLEKDYSSSAAETILPDGCLDLIFHVGSGLYTVTDGQIDSQPPGLLIGQLKQPLVLFSGGITTTLGIRFYPYGAYPFLRSSLQELVNRTTNIEFLFEKSVRDLIEKIAALPPIAAFQELERFLMAQLSKHEVEIAEVKAAIRLLHHQRGMANIDDLARYCNLSLRSLERKFTEVTGFAPKTLARIIRFNSLKNELMLHPVVNLTELGYRYDYFDQAHFIKDFKQFTDKTPSEFAESVVNGQILFYK